MFSSTHFNNCVHLWDHYLKQVMKHFHHSRKCPCAVVFQSVLSPSLLSSSHPQGITFRLRSPVDATQGLHKNMYSLHLRESKKDNTLFRAVLSEIRRLELGADFPLASSKSFDMLGLDDLMSIMSIIITVPTTWQKRERKITHLSWQMCFFSFPFLCQVLF